MDGKSYLPSHYNFLLIEICFIVWKIVHRNSLKRFFKKSSMCISVRFCHVAIFRTVNQLCNPIFGNLYTDFLSILKLDI